MENEIATDQDDNFVSVHSENAEMSEAIEQAKASIGQFFQAFLSFDPKYSHFALKVRFEESGKGEHIWLTDLDFKTKPTTGVVGNEPRIKSLSYMERVPFTDEQISDWMYMENENLVGGFTSKVLLRTQSKEGGLMGLLRRRFKM